MKSFKKPREHLRRMGKSFEAFKVRRDIEEKRWQRAMKPEGMKVISGALPQSESAQGAETHKLFRAVQSSEETKNSF